MKKLLAALLVGVGLAAPAHANFVVTGGTDLSGQTAADYSALGNDFAAELIALGYTSFNTGGLLEVTLGGLLEFAAFGSESFFSDSLWLGGVKVFEETDGAVKTPYPSTVFFSMFSTQAVLNGLLATMEFRGGDNALMTSAAFAFFYNPFDLSSIMLAYDDNSANPDSDYDDLLVRVTFVPEPSAWALMILGFAGLGSVRRRLRANIA